LKGLKLLRNKGLGVKVAKIPEGKDPADIVETDGREKLKEIFNSAQPFHEFYLDLLKGEYDLSTVEGREKALKSSTRFLSEVKSPPLRHELIDRLKDMLNISASEITRRVKLKGRDRSSGTGLKVDRTQEGLSLDEWVVHLLIEGRLSREALEEEGILEELNPKLQPLAEKIVDGRNSGSDLEEIMQDMGEKEREELSRISLVEVKFEEKNAQKASEEVIKKFIKQKRLPKLQEERRRALEEGDEDKIQQIQKKIATQQEKLKEYR
jgi:DNA primase